MSGEPVEERHVGHNKCVGPLPLALIIARKGPLRDALEALLTVMPGIRRTEKVDDYAAAQRVVAHHRPMLVVSAVDAPVTDTAALLRQIKAETPATKCLVLTQTVEQQHALQAAGADAALLLGTSPHDLSSVVEHLLPP